MEKTTDLSVIRQRPSKFVWGKVVEIYDVGAYTILEYIKENSEQRLFHCYLSGKSLNTSARTLDGALVICIARANLGATQYADWAPVAVCKALNIPE